MYRTFFGLCESPFNVNPDPRFLYLTPQTQAALDELTYGIQNRKGFILLTGEVGTGKTTLINYLLNWLRARKTPTAFIFNSHLSANHLFDFILNDFGVPVDCRLNNNMLIRLNAWLIERYRAGETPVLIIDEAQGLSTEVLEEIRLLLNLETASEKLLQIVLAGQPELEQKLKRPELRQLQQRITLKCKTGTMSIEQTHGYIKERLRIAGATGAPIFASEAMDAVYFYSLGIPRITNLLCEHALINAYVEQSRLVLARMVEDAAHEFLLDEDRPISIRRASSELGHDNLAILHTIFATGLTNPSGVERVKAPEQAVEILPIIPPDTSPVTRHAQVGAMATEPVLGSEPLARQESMRAGVPSGKKAAAYALHVESNTSAAGCVDSDSTDKRKHGTVVAMPAVSVSAPSAGNLSMAAAEKVAIAPERSNQKVTRAPAPASADGDRCKRGKGQTAMVPDEWPRMSHTVLFKMMSSLLLVRKLTQCWARDFKRDWMAMIRATPWPAIKESFLRWLRQPIRRGVWRPEKVAALHARRNVAP
jgi:general secretion pathway protein A